MPDARLAAAMNRIDASLAAKRAQRAANQSQAPICGAFVQDLRETFGADVAVTYVNEEGFVMGKPDDRPTKESGPVTVFEQNGRKQTEKVVAAWIHL